MSKIYKITHPDLVEELNKRDKYIGILRKRLGNI